MKQKKMKNDLILKIVLFIPLEKNCLEREMFSSSSSLKTELVDIIIIAITVVLISMALIIILGIHI